MAENPALEWNARDEPSSLSQMMARVSLTPVLTRCSVRFIYAPPIVSVEQQCIIVGEALEASASSLSELHLFIDVSQLNYYQQWVATLQPPKGKEDLNLVTTATQYPSHIFITCNRINAIVYQSAQSGSSLTDCPYLPHCSLVLVKPHLLIKRTATAGIEPLYEVATYDVRLQLPCWTNGSPVCSSSLPDDNKKIFVIARVI